MHTYKIYKNTKIIIKILKRGTKKPARQSQIARDDLGFDHLATTNINKKVYTDRCADL